MNLEAFSSIRHLFFLLILTLATDQDFITEISHEKSIIKYIWNSMINLKIIIINWSSLSIRVFNMCE